MTHNNTTLSPLPPFIESSNIYTVAELNSAINVQLQQNFGVVYVEGEISNLVKASSGHCYFTLKDCDSQVKCALFKGFRTFIKAKLENGQKILVKAKISIYLPRGDYQLIVEHVYPTGLGALQQAFEALKQKLQLEGLFSEQHKKPLPKIPHQIWVVTSSTGAAIKDILTTLKRRFASIPVKIIPTLVQGATAAENIIKALNYAEQSANPLTDVIILARGGGSLEDLWSFNDEQLARTIFKLKTPVITGIGHEIDFTIADFVSDLRAATPTAAAEAASIHNQDYLANIIYLESHLAKNFKHLLLQAKHTLNHLQQKLLQHHPQVKIINQVQQIDELYLKLVFVWEKNRNYHQNYLLILGNKILSFSPNTKIAYHKQTINHYQNRLNNLIKTLLDRNKSHLMQQVQALNAHNPLDVLTRGYSITQTSEGVVITDCEQVESGDKLNIRLAKGEILAVVE